MKISVIIPVYNIMDCLERCVHSVQSQTYRNMEIILVDDGSTDGTSELVDRLAQSDPLGRTIAFHKENGGSSSARNYGITKATGEYFGFVDSDDYIEPDMYANLANAVLEHNLLVAQIGRDEVSADGSRRGDVIEPRDSFGELNSKDFCRELLLHRGDCSFCTKLVKRELFDNSLFPEGELNEDFWLLIQMLLASDNGLDSIGILPEIGYHVFYRETSNSRTIDCNVFPRVFTDIVVNADRTERLISDVIPELSDYALRFALVQRLDYLLHIPVGMMSRDNDFYVQVVEYIKSHRGQIDSNPYLNNDQRKKLKILSLAPKLIRQLHKVSMKIRGVI